MRLLLLVLLIITYAMARPTLPLLASVHAEHQRSHVQRGPSAFEFQADTTCPAIRPEAEGVLDRFLLSSGYEEAFDAYGITGIDTSEVVVVADSAVCMALDSTLAQSLPDSTLSFIQSMYDRSYFATDSFYYGVDLPHRPEPDSDYVFVAMGGILVFGKDFSFKRDFLF